MSDHDINRQVEPGETGRPAMQVRRARTTDAEAFAQMMSDPEVYPQLLQMPYGDTDLWRERLTKMCAANQEGLLLVVEAHGEVIGAAGLHSTGPSPRRRHVMYIGIQVRSDWQGRGAGTLLMKSLCDYADRWLGISRLELTVYVDNLRAQELYRRFGFVDEGLHRAYALRDGRYVDAVAMARLVPMR
ncbi:GNAT family N-acetyltransferase [Variovorax ureilyticus]|uniref:GNAT family N-acetyltransferase n=1 Tax=Variovorax ureilyticus TaxID=1836198 RepID=A0ABU8VJ63_9BURK